MSENETKVVKRKARRDTHLTSGLGFGNAKKQQLELFWNIVWPRLSDYGWRQVKGEGEDTGPLYFVPKDVDIESAQKGRDYYDRIKDVIDRVQEKRNEEEANIAETFTAELEMLFVDESDDGEVVVPRSRRSRRVAVQTESEGESVDVGLNWKEGDTKKSSRVGTEYQATDILPAGSFVMPDTTNSDLEQEQDAMYDQVWDHQQANDAGVADYVHTKVATSKKEEGMVALHQQNYQTDEIEDVLARSSAVDGSDWTDSEREQFRYEIFRLRKDIGKVAKAMNKSVNSCMTYYFGNFKKSDDYRLLKTVCAEERAEKEAEKEERGEDSCAICEDGGELLICDGCEREYHMSCVRPPLAQVPEGQWECDDCVNTEFYRARDRLIRHTQLFQEVKDSDRKRKFDQIASGGEESQDETKDISESQRSRSGSTDELKLRPSPEVLAAVKKLATSISAALSTSRTASASDSAE